MRRSHSGTRFPAMVGGLTVVLALGGCSKGPTHLTAPGTASEPAGRIRVNNSAAQLSRRVHDTNGVKLQIEPVPAAKRVAGDATRLAPMAARNDITLSLIAEVDPPELLGTTLQANHITMQRGKVYVAYNVQGPLFMGGVDVFDVSPPNRPPSLISSMLYSDTDVNGVDAKDGRLFMATATAGAAAQAGLEAMTLDGELLTADVVRKPLPSYAGTGVVAHGGLVLATSGDGADGGVAAFDATSLAPVWRQDFGDARAVTTHGTTVVTMAGQPCTMRMYDGATGAPAALPYCTPGGAMLPHSKGTVVVHQGLAFVAAGDGGTRIVRLADGVVTDVMPVPNGNGLPSELAVTNAVAVSGNHVYMANGGAGLWVARLRHEKLEALGHVAFADGASVNFVAAHGNLLFVATGTGGLRVVRIHGGGQP